MPDISLNSTGHIRPFLGGTRYCFQSVCGVRLRDYAGDLQHADWIDTRNSIQIFRSAPDHCSRRGLLCGTFQCAGRHIVADNSADRDICDPAAAWISLHRAAQARRDAMPAGDVPRWEPRSLDKVHAEVRPDQIGPFRVASTKPADNQHICKGLWLVIGWLHG